MSLKNSFFYAVVGNPIAHSKSPLIHQIFAQSIGLTLHYERIRVPLRSFELTMNALADRGLRGSNVTIPFKLEAFTLAKTHSQRALDAQAANFLQWQDDGTWHADNTDGAGLVADLQRLRGGVGSLNSARVLLLGAGGAVQGCVAPLVAAGATVHIANRTADKAHAIAEMFKARGLVGVSGHALTDELPACDVIVNGTAASIQGLAVSPNVGAVRNTAVISAKTLAYDMMYSTTETPFMRICREQGAVTTDGFGMLIEQAAESFYLWHGVMPQTNTVHELFKRG
jgi:shikimate dehydrogenase